MSEPPVILAAPPPGSPPPTAPPASEGSPLTTKDERLLAAVPYLSYFLGFWLVAPIVVYVLKREQSRFVAHHAVRAILLHLVAAPLMIFSWVLTAAVHVFLALLIPDGHGKPRAGFGALWMAGVILAWSVPWIWYMAVTVLGAVRAFQGRIETRSLLGRVVERFLGQDRTVAGPPPAER